jgi:ABC-type multidrug transport system fused ATPase/permease subunit
MHAALMQVASGRTTLLIAHRPSTIRLADRVVVVRDGEIAEMGSYDELLAADGELAALLAGPGSMVG